MKRGRARLRSFLITLGVLMGLFLLGVGIYTFVLLDKTTEVFQGSPMDVLNPKPLRKDDQGYSNILVFGTSEDDEGHSGALLADSILVLSVSEEKKGRVFSIPRDLLVDYGKVCTLGGTSGKINAAYVCGLNDNNRDEDKASQYFSELVSGITGVEIQYYVHVSYDLLRELTDTLGGIDVEIYTDDERGLYDKNQKLRLSPGVNHLDGETALKLSRARNSKGGYGLSRSNFDREINQQRIIQAIIEKTKKSLTPGMAMEVVDKLSKNMKTNITLSEIKYVADHEHDFKKLGSIDTSKVFTTGQSGSMSVVLPKAGEKDYSELKELIAKKRGGEK